MKYSQSINPMKATLVLLSFFKKTYLDACDVVDEALWVVVVLPPKGLEPTHFFLPRDEDD